MKRLNISERMPNKVFKKSLNIDAWPNDDLLMTRIGNDDVEAFKLIYDKYWESSYLFACSKLPSAVEARYIIEHLFIYLWECRNCLSRNKNVEAFLGEELKKRIVKYYRDAFLK